VCKQVTIGFGFTFDWLKEAQIKASLTAVRESEVKQNQSKHNITFDTHLKTVQVQGFSEFSVCGYWTVFY